MVHRHEPPVTSTPVEILRQEQDYIIINKPGSIVCLGHLGSSSPQPSLFSRSTLRDDITGRAWCTFSDSSSVSRKYIVCGALRASPPSCHSMSPWPHAAINRLDRLTSGLMIIPLTTELARTLGTEFIQGKVQKEYIARCRGEFPKCAFSSRESMHKAPTILSPWLSCC